MRSSLSLIHNHEPSYEVLYLSGRRGGGVGPIYSIPPFVQRGQGLGDILGGLFKTIRPLFLQAYELLVKKLPKL